MGQRGDNKKDIAGNFLLFGIIPGQSAFFAKFFISDTII